MVLTLDTELETALLESARRKGVSPEQVAADCLRRELLPGRPDAAAFEEWKRRLRSAASDCGVSLSDEAVSSEGIYE